MDAIELLREDHENVLTMLRRLEDTPTADTGATDEALEARDRMVTELVIAESRHEAVEEQFFWPMVRDSVPGGEELASRALAQESSAKRLLDALERTPLTDPRFEELLEQVIRDGREHIEFEQDRVWPRVRESVSDDQLDALGDRMAKAKHSAPTRPHPATPSTPGAQKSAGPVAAMLDKLRDAMSGRGKS